MENKNKINKNIFDRLSDNYNGWKKRNKEIINMPKDFWINLNELDYKKYKDNLPKKEIKSSSFYFVYTFYKMGMIGVLFYAVADFMNYESVLNIMEAFKLLFGSIANAFIIIFFTLLTIDIINFLNLSYSEDKHNLRFYRRLKGGKK